MQEMRDAIAAYIRAGDVYVVIAGEERHITAVSVDRPGRHMIDGGCGEFLSVETETGDTFIVSDPSRVWFRVDR